jgi:hypothetical protein
MASKTPEMTKLEEINALVREIKSRKAKTAKDKYEILNLKDRICTMGKKLTVEIN